MQSRGSEERRAPAFTTPPACSDAQTPAQPQPDISHSSPFPPTHPRPHLAPPPADLILVALHRHVGVHALAQVLGAAVVAVRAGYGTVALRGSRQGGAAGAATATANRIATPTPDARISTPSPPPPVFGPSIHPHIHTSTHQLKV